MALPVVGTPVWALQHYTSTHARVRKNAFWGAKCYCLNGWDNFIPIRHLKWGLHKYPTKMTVTVHRLCIKLI